MAVIWVSMSKVKVAGLESGLVWVAVSEFVSSNYSGTTELTHVPLADSHIVTLLRVRYSPQNVADACRLQLHRCELTAAMALITSVSEVTGSLRFLYCMSMCVFVCAECPN